MRDYAFGVVSYEEDAIFRPAEERALGEHLYGSEDGWTYSAVGGTEAVHCMPYSAPEASVEVFRQVTAAIVNAPHAAGAETA